MRDNRLPCFPTFMMDDCPASLISHLFSMYTLALVTPLFVQSPVNALTIP